jgi:uncharacterized Rmd1/YagE family protein
MTFDECVYTTYTYDIVDAARNGVSSSSQSQRDRAASLTKTGDLLGIPELNEEAEGGSGNSAEGGNGAGNNGTSSSTTLVDGTTEEEESRRLEKERMRRREEARRERKERFTVKGAQPEVFFMEYGTIVIWGMTLSEEKRLLREIRRFEVEKLAQEDVESEELNWYLADYSR